MIKKSFTTLLTVLATVGLFSCSAPSSGGLSSGAFTEGASSARAGLATGLGDTVLDRTTGTAFVRKAGAPAGVSSIYYNDAEGMKEARESGSSYRVPGMMRDESGLVKWGVKSGFSSLSGRLFYNSEGRRRMVKARQGKSYSIVIENICKARVEVVVSVDGLDVIDGKTASTGKRGYIIEPGDTLEIKGFRTSQDAVAAFEFSSVGASYANQRHGDTRNVGVIGMAVFVEKGSDPWRSREQVIREDARPFAVRP